MADDVKMRVSLDDRASKELLKISNALKTLAKETKNVAEPTKQASLGFRTLVTSMTAASLASMAITKSLQLVTTEFGSMITQANKYQAAMMGLSSVAAAFGADQTKARDSAKSLSEDGLMSVTESATGLKNLLATGFSLDEANELMLRFKDSAAFGKQGALEFGEAIVGATEGVKNGNSLLVDNAGVTKNLSMMLEEAGYSAQDLMKASSDAGVRQAIFNGILKETAAQAGDAARIQDTLAGSTGALKTEANELRATLGEAMSPAIKILVDGLREMIGGVDTSDGTMKTLAQTVAITAAVLRGLAAVAITVAKDIGAAVVGIAKALGALFQGSLEGIQTAYNEYSDSMNAHAAEFGVAIQSTKDDLESALTGIEDRYNNGTKNISKDMIPRVSAAAKDAGKKTREALEKEAQDFSNSVKKMQQSFNDSMRDLVVNHKAHLKELEGQRDEENSNFNERMADQKETYNKAMSDMEERHQEKVETITEQIVDEQRKLEEEIQKINDKYRDQMKQFAIAGKERLDSVQRDIDKELARGQNANQEKVANLQAMLENERIALEDQTKIKEEVIENEKNTVRAEYDDRVSELRQRLAEENAEIVAAAAERTAEYEKETAKIRSEHDKRLSSLNDEINKEKELQKKYAAEFAQFKDAVAEDDITRLKANFARERAELEEQHQQKLQDIARRAQEENATKSAASVKTNTSTSKSLIDAKSSYKAPNASYEKYSSSINDWVQFHADGGVFNKPHIGVVAERGREAIVPLDNPARAQQVMQQAGLNGGGNNITIHMPVQVVDNKLDIDLIAERVAQKLGSTGLI